jgi:alkylation response protein AidB-like acyl-CoA dehydrogenase
MPFQLTPAEEQVRKITREYAERYIIPRRKELMKDDRKMWDEEADRQCKFGLHLHIVPREQGGTGLGFVASCITVEELCAAWPDLSLMIYGEFAYYFCNAMTPELKAKLLPDVISGKKKATAVITEPSGGSDVMGLTTNAKKVSGGWVINGRKCFASEGEYADFIMTLVKTGDPNDPATRGGKSLTAFIVEKGMPGFRIGRMENTLGRKGDLTEFVFDNVFVPDTHVVGGEQGVGRGMAPVFGAVADVGRLTICGMLNGITAGCLRESVKYAKERKLYGRPISELQAIQHRIADMTIDLAAARSLTYRAAYMRTRGLRCNTELSIAKYFATQAALRASLHAVNIFGAYGTLEDYMPHHYYRHTPLRITAGGTDELMKNMIAAGAINTDGNPDMGSKIMEEAGW